MSAHADTSNLQPGKHSVSNRVRTMYSVFIFIGVTTFVIGLLRAPERIWPSYLTSYFYFVSLALGGLFFSAIQYVTRAGWSVNVRRMSESMTSFLPWAAVGAVVLLFGARELYIWLDHDIVSKDHVLEHKAAYLNLKFFIVRLIAFIALWLFFVKKIIGNSLQQDHSGASSLTLKNVKYGVAFILTFALSYSLFSVDLLMSVQPHWFSTIFGVYCFAGLFYATFSMLFLFTLHLKITRLPDGFVIYNFIHANR